MSKMENKVVIVTDAAMGNGLGIAKVLAKYRGKVVLADISAKVHEASEQLNSEGYETMAVEMDVSNPESVNAAVKQVIEKYGRIDSLVNNAGVIRLGSLLDATDEDRDFQFNININGVWNVSKAVLPYMREAKYGRNINLSSVTGMMVADPGETAYAT